MTASMATKVVAAQSIVFYVSTGFVRNQGSSSGGFSQSIISGVHPIVTGKHFIQVKFKFRKFLI